MNRRVVLAAAFFIVLTLFFFHPIFRGNIPFPGDLLIGEYVPYSGYSFEGFSSGSYPNKGQDFDVIRLIFPAKEFSIQSLKIGEIPLWNPYNFSGNPHLASLQSGTFYPINFIFFFLPFIHSWVFYIILQPILAGIFTYLLLKKYNLSDLASVFGGTVFAFSSFFSVWMLYGNLGHTFIWLPLILLLLHNFIARPDTFKAILIILVLSSSILAGYIQTTLYVFIFSFIYGICLLLSKGKTNKKTIFYLFIIFLLPALFSATQILPTIELFQNSTRNAYSTLQYLKLLIPVNHIITFFSPDFFGNPATRNYWLTGTYIERVSYVGIIPLFFALFSLGKKRRKIIIFYLVLALVVFFLVFDTVITRFLYSIYIPPIFATSVPSRMMFLFCFSLSILSAFGLDEFCKKENKKKFILISGLLLTIFFFLWIFVMFYPAKGELAANLIIAKRNLILPTGILLIGLSLLVFGFAFKKYKRLVLHGVFILTIFDLFYFFNKITPFVSYKSVYPQTPVLTKLKQIQGIDRFWGYGSGYIEANVQSVERVYSPNGYDALHLKLYGEFITASEKGKIVNPPPRSDVVIAPGFGKDDLRNNSFRQNILNLLGVKYVLHKYPINNPDYETFPSENYKLVWSDNTFQIYQNLHSLPRFFLTSDFIVERNKEKRINLLVNSKVSKKIILEENPGIKSFTEGKSGKVELQKYNANNVSFLINSDEQKMLFLSDTYDKGWQARIDGSYAKIYKANQVFRAVLVPKGKHLVEFLYKPKSFETGFKISLISILLSALYIVFDVLRKSRSIKK